jgi:hypothetical protein
MNNAASNRARSQIPTPSGKKCYRPPRLQSLGKLHLQTQGSGGTRFDANLTMRPRMSDRLAKENLVRIGDHPLGIGLYLFDYKPEFRDAWGRGRQLGVMADEVERVMPQAVSVHADGYGRVDYAMLGFVRLPH